MLTLPRSYSNRFGSLARETRATCTPRNLGKRGKTAGARLRCLEVRLLNGEHMRLYSSVSQKPISKEPRLNPHSPSLHPIQRLLTRHTRPPRPPQPPHLRLISLLRFLPRSLLSLVPRPNLSLRRRRGRSLSRNRPARSLATFRSTLLVQSYCVFAPSTHTLVRARSLPLPRQIRCQARSAAHSATLWDLRL
jgi:hypothetical protein